MSRVRRAALLLLCAVPAPAAAQGLLAPVHDAATGYDENTGWYARIDEGAEARVRALIQYDAGLDAGGAGDDRGLTSFGVRRARLTVEARASRWLAFRVTPEFGGPRIQLEDAFADLSLGRALWLRVGRMRVPFGYERARLIIEQRFPERSLVSNLTANRDNGLMLTAAPGSGALEVTAGLFNGTADNTSSGSADVDDDKEGTLRVIAHLVRRRRAGAAQGVFLGVNGTAGTRAGRLEAAQVAAFRSSAGLTFLAPRAGAGGTVLADGGQQRLGLFGAAHLGPAGLVAEVNRSWQDVRLDAARAELGHTAWLVQGAWVLTGEPSQAGGVLPRRRFAPDAGALGALELMARVASLRVDDAAFPVYADPSASARRATAVGVGLAWYVSRLTKAQLAWETTSYRGGAAGGDRPADHQLLLRLQAML